MTLFGMVLLVIYLMICAVIIWIGELNVDYDEEEDYE